jgi:hypothetical protein
MQSTDLNLINLLFSDFQTTFNGGVLSIHGQHLNIYSCIFSNICSPTTGGSLYLIKCKFFLKCSKFFNCYATGTSENGGNAFYIDGDELNISFLLIDHCGPTSTQRGDSSLLSKNNYFSILYYNSTWNYGIVGCSCFSVHYSPLFSYVKFSQDMDCEDNFVFETFYNQYSINFTNIINSSSCTYSIFWTSSNNTLVLDSCIFINPKLKFEYHDYSIISINCFSDTDIPLAYTKTNFLTINNFYVNFLNNFCSFSPQFIHSCIIFSEILHSSSISPFLFIII